jgi:hypothetical protein
VKHETDETNEKVEGELMRRKFKIANGLNATFHWIRELPNVMESCRKDWVKHVSKTLNGNYAVVTIDVKGEPLHFVEWATEEDAATANFIMSNWKTDKNLPKRTHWVVYRNHAYYSGTPTAALLVDSVKRKIPPGINYLINGGP